MDSAGATLVPAGGPGQDPRAFGSVPGYRRREPEKSLLHQTVREHLRTFLAETDFGSALNLNVHFHAVVPDEVWVRDQGAVRFLALPAPTDEDVQEVFRRIERRVRAFLKPRLEAARGDARPPDALAASQAESV